MRQPVALDHMKTFLNRVNITGFDAGQYLDGLTGTANVPTVAISVSGGGYRAMLNGAGAIKAWDERTPGATDAGNLGGLLQSATYITGLSGGSWLLGSIYVNNFTQIDTLASGENTWNLDNDLFQGPPKQWDPLSTVQYWSEIHDAVMAKQKAGFRVSITDIWYGAACSLAPRRIQLTPF